jgi:ATP-dependent Clp protease ATP-binding subunit ClpA
VGYEEGGQLTNPVKNKPYSLVLLDEIEKAHPKVFDVFLQILDDGRLTDGRGKLVDFRNTMIIATSNAGIEDILDLIEEGKQHSEIEKEIKDIMQDYFRIEFINRFDDIVVFKALDVPSLVGIADLQVRKLAIELYARGITLEVKPETLQQLAESAYDPKYGARGLQRVIQENLENPIVEMLMQDQVKPGERIVY